MRFLVDADLPRATAALLDSYGHEAVDVRDIGLRSAKDSEIATYARQQGLCLLTGDVDFSDIRTYPPQQYPGLVVLKIPRNATARYILSLLEGFLQQDHIIAMVHGKLAVVEPGRVRLRHR